MDEYLTTIGVKESDVVSPEESQLEVDPETFESVARPRDDAASSDAPGLHGRGKG